MKKRFLVLFVLFLALSVITSCKKKEDSTQTGPVVTVAEEKDYERRTFDKDIPTLTVNDDPIVERDTTREENIEEEKVEANESRKLSFVYRGGSTLFRSTFSSDKGEIKTNISEEEAKAFVSRLLEENPEYEEIYTVSFSSDTVYLWYPSSTSDDDISALWNKVRDLMDRINGEKAEMKETLKAEINGEEISAVLLDDRAQIAIGENIDKEDIVSFMSYISIANPDLAAKAEYEIEEGNLNLIYKAPMDTEEVRVLWDELVSEVQSFIKGDGRTETEAVEAKGEEVVLPVSSEEEKEEAAVVSPLSSVGKLVNSFSVSLSAVLKYDTGLTSDIRATFDYSLSSQLSIGVTSGYEIKGYIPMLLRLRYDIPQGYGLYTFVESGWRFGINGNKGSFIVAPGVGYELEVLDDFYVYGEFDVQASFGESFKLMPGLSIGGRYSF